MPCVYVTENVGKTTSTFMNDKRESINGQMCLGPGREEKEEEETRMTFCECHVDRRWIIRFPPSPSRIDPDALPINPIKPTCQCPLLPGRRARQVMSTSAARPLVEGGLRLKVAASPQWTGRGWPQAKTKMCTPGGVVANLQRITSFS